VGWTQKIPLLALVCLLTLAVDQATKFWAVENLTRAFEVESAASLAQKLRSFWVMENLEPLRKSPITVVDGFWRFRYLENPGAAWGFLGSVDPRFRLPFFRSAPLLAMALLGLLYFRAARYQLRLRLSLALVLGGALGNFVDRWIHGYVIDFVDWQFSSYHWPTFNVADVAISLGVLGVALESLAASRRRRRRAAEAEIESRASGEGESAPPESDPPVEAPEPDPTRSD
jgi:signal peptidase II